MFISFVLGWISSLSVYYQLASVPNAVVCLLILLLIVVLMRQVNQVKYTLIKLGCYFLLGAIIGINWASLDRILMPQLPDVLFEAKQGALSSTRLIGQVVGLPSVGMTDYGKPKVKFEFWVQKICVQNCELSTAAWQTFSNPVRPVTIQLSWYQYTHLPKTGETWQFAVSLKPNHASLNAGGFDYESYLFAHQIAAKGYVLKQPQAVLLVPSTGGLRSQVAEVVAQTWQFSSLSGVFRALLVGDKSGVTAEQWQVLQQTGTVHLMAIAGLHIAILALLGFGVFAGVWHGLIRLGYVYWQQVPKVYVASLGSLLFATVYMVLSGFALPTQRAWLMLVSGLLLIVMKRQFQPWSALALAALLVTLWAPRSVLLQGAWLSFAAVALIFMCLFHPKIKGLNKWHKVWLVQVVLSLGLMPLLFFYYQQVPVFGVLTNLLVVPFVSLVGLPLLFISTVLGWVSLDWAQPWIQLTDWLWQSVWLGLIEVTSWSNGWLNGQITLTSLLAIYGLLMVWVWWARLPVKWVWLTLIGALMLFNSQNWGKNNQAWVTVLDVGQGLSVVIETDNHTLVYDTGSRWSAQFDGAAMAIVPFLNSRERYRIDRLIVSHSDIDHAGGSARLFETYSGMSAFSGQAEKLNTSLGRAYFSPCLAGQTWQWEGIKFELLAPMPTWPVVRDDNDYSCVLKVSTPERSLIVSGDLSQEYEQALVAELGQGLRADYLVAGHHGSKTATSLAWLQAVSPTHIIYSAGYKNAFKFPHSDVTERVNKLGIQQWNTACDGMIQFNLLDANAGSLPVAWRPAHHKWFYAKCE